MSRSSRDADRKRAGEAMSPISGANGTPVRAGPGAPDMGAAPVGHMAMKRGGAFAPPQS
jgi:hypothetical protein